MDRNREHFQTKQYKEDGVLHLINNLPEAIDAFVGNRLVGMIEIETPQGDPGSNSFQGS